MIIYINQKYILPVTKVHRFGRIVSMTFGGGLPMSSLVIAKSTKNYGDSKLYIEKRKDGLYDLSCTDTAYQTTEKLKNNYNPAPSYQTDAKTVKVKVGNKWVYQQTKT
jgi:hypothetical protein